MKRLFLIAFGVLTTLAFAQPTLELQITEYPPYMYTENGVPSGVGVERVQQLLKAASLEAKVTVAANYGRALKAVSDGKSDGFFLASRSSERDAEAHFIGPLVMNRWTWFLRADSTLDPQAPDFGKKAVISTVLNSNQHSYLTVKQFNIGITPQSAEVLPVILIEKQKADAVLVPDLVFWHALEKSKLGKEKVKSVLMEEKPFGLYLSKAFEAKYPGTLEKLQEALKK